MIFEIHGIKVINLKDEKTGLELDPINVPIDFLIDCSTENEVREILKTVGVVLLSLKQYKEKIDTYGNIYAKIDLGNKEYNLLLKINTLEESYSFLTETVGAKVKYINSRTNKVPDEKIYEFLEQQYNLEEEKKVGEKEKEKKTQVEDKKVIALRKLVVDLIDEASMVEEKTKSRIYPDLSRKLSGAIDLLKRYRWSYNTEMMSKCIELTLKYMEMAEINLLEKTRSQETTNIKQDILSDLDIVKEYEKYKTSQKAFESSKIIGNIKLTKEQKFYTFFGKVGIYFRLLYSDGIKRYSSIKVNFSTFVHFVQIFIIFCIINLVLYYIFNIFSQNSSNAFSVYYFLSFFGLIGLISLFFNLFKKDNFGFLLLFLFGGAALFAILRYLVIITFAI